MYVCTYVCMYVCVYVYTYVDICIYIYVSIYIHIWCMWMYLHYDYMYVLIYDRQLLACIYIYTH